MTVSLENIARTGGDLGRCKAFAILLQRKSHINQGAPQYGRDLTKLQTTRPKSIPRCVMHPGDEPAVAQVFSTSR
jgi:hypothetical protein